MAGKIPRNDKEFTRTHRPYRRTGHPPAMTMITRSHCSTNSLFTTVPAEVLDMILDKLSVWDISVFSMVSKEINGYVMDYISTLAWKKKNIIQSFHRSTCPEQKFTIGHYRDLGLLFKRSTMLLPTKDRLKFILSRFSKIPCFMLEQCLAPDCIGFSSYGVFLQTLIAGWDELECHRVFSFLCNITNLQQNIEALLTAKPGVRWFQEMQLRLFCRQVLLDPWSNQSEWHFWLMQLLKPWPIVTQSHLLLILYGPLLPERTLGWQDLVERPLPHIGLWDLAKAIIMLVDKSKAKAQTTDSMLAIWEELIVIPQPWHAENVARLLVLCGSSFCYTVLATKAVSGRVHEISSIIVFIILVCEKDGYDMTWAVRLVQQICTVFNTAPEKFNFIQQLEIAFSEVTREMFEFSLAGNHFEDRGAFQNLSILLDSCARFHTQFLHMLMK